jgi:hypothetical protein
VSGAVPTDIAESPRLQPERRPTLYRTLVRIAVPLAILTAGVWVHFAPQTHGSRFCLLLLEGAGAGYVAVVVGPRRARDVLAIVAAILFGLAAVEGYFVYAYRTTFDSNTPGHSVAMPVLGWGPAHPDIYRHTKTEIKTGRVD